LKAQGLTSVNRQKEFWDYNGSWGGPLQRTKLWFWNSLRHWGTETYRAGVYYNQTLPPAWAYTPDLSRQFAERSSLQSYALRLTWQAAARHKLSVYYDYNPTCFCDRSNTAESQSPEATDNWYNRPNDLIQATWKAPLTNRLFLQANTTIYRLSLREICSFGMAPAWTLSRHSIRRWRFATGLSPWRTTSGWAARTTTPSCTARRRTT